MVTLTNAERLYLRSALPGKDFAGRAIHNHAAVIALDGTSWIATTDSHRLYLLHRPGLATGTYHFDGSSCTLERDPSAKYPDISYLVNQSLTRPAYRIADGIPQRTVKEAKAQHKADVADAFNVDNSTYLGPFAYCEWGNLTPYAELSQHIAGVNPIFVNDWVRHSDDTHYLHRVEGDYHCTKPLALSDGNGHRALIMALHLTV